MATVSTNRRRRSIMPSPADMPAIPDAIPAENGFTIEARQPTCVPRTAIITATTVSIPKASIAGMNIIKYTMSSSYAPYRVPKNAITVVRAAMSKWVRFWLLRVMILMPALRAPVRSIISRKLPKSRMVSEMEIAPLMVSDPSIPVMGAMSMSHKPCGFDSTAWYVPAMASPVSFTS